MKLLTLTLLLAVPTPLTFFTFVFVATALYTYALLNHLTNSHDQHPLPVSLTNSRDQRI